MWSIRLAVFGMRETQFQEYRSKLTAAKRLLGGMSFESASTVRHQQGNDLKAANLLSKKRRKVSSGKNNSKNLESRQTKPSVVLMPVSSKNEDGTPSILNKQENKERLLSKMRMVYKSKGQSSVVTENSVKVSIKSGDPSNNNLNTVDSQNGNDNNNESTNDPNDFRALSKAKNSIEMMKAKKIEADLKDKMVDLETSSDNETSEQVSAYDNKDFKTKKSVLTPLLSNSTNDSLRLEKSSILSYENSQRDSGSVAITRTSSSSTFNINSLLRSKSVADEQIISRVKELEKRLKLISKRQRFRYLPDLPTGERIVKAAGVIPLTEKDRLETVRPAAQVGLCGIEVHEYDPNCGFFFRDRNGNYNPHRNHPKSLRRAMLESKVWKWRR